MSYEIVCFEIFRKVKNFDDVWQIFVDDIIGSDAPSIRKRNINQQVLGDP